MWRWAWGRRLRRGDDQEHDGGSARTPVPDRTGRRRGGRGSSEPERRQAPSNPAPHLTPALESRWGESRAETLFGFDGSTRDEKNVAHEGDIDEEAGSHEYEPRYVVLRARMPGTGFCGGRLRCRRGGGRQAGLLRLTPSRPPWIPWQPTSSPRGSRTPSSGSSSTGALTRCLPMRT